MATLDVSQPSERAGGHRYPPLLVLAMAVAVAILVLPSALHIPQTNPNPVLEYAPVPPEEPNPDVPPGNFSSLGLGGSSTLSQGARPATPSPPATRKPSALLKPRSTRCYLDPQTGERRQTEDPMSPPCSEFFEGDNFGATWQGVTGDEITVLIYLDVGCPNQECSRGSGTYIDLDEPPKPACPKTWPAPNTNGANCDYIWLRIARGFNHYFNARYQLYGRRVHYHAYMSSATSAQARSADAVDNVKRLRPFAVIDYATYYGNNLAYDQAMAARDVVVVSSRSLQPNAYYAEAAPAAWSFWPDSEHWAALYASYVCQKVAPYPVRHYGLPPYTEPPNGSRRVFGFFYTTDPNEPGIQRFVERSRELLARCGVTPAAEGTFPKNGFAVDATDSGLEQGRAVDRFKSAGVTTVLWLGGSEGKFSQMAAQKSYYPEIVVAGDLENDNNEFARRQDQTVWRNAWAMQLQLRMDRPEETVGYRAYREGNPDALAEEARFANEMYRDHFMLFQAIQVAGPRLTPDTIDQGFHAIPPKPNSESAYIAACFFDPGDYTCAKDAQEVWWDPAGDSPASDTPGCWRMVRGGLRSQAGRWRGADDVFRNSSDPCTGFESRFQAAL